MRSELTILEQIDLYLTGELPPTEHAAFESKISSDPALEGMVQKQKELIQAAKRKALRAQINSVAIAAGGGAGGVGGGFTNLFYGVTGLVLAGVITMTVIYFNGEATLEKDDVLVENENLMPLVDSLGSVNYEMEEVALNIESPETIFSTLNTYPEEVEEERMNVVIDFETSNENVIKSPQYLAEGAVLREVDNRREVVVPEIDHSEAVNLSSRALFPGGNSELKGFIDKNLRYPKSAKDKKIEGIVRCDFHVTPDGLITEIKAECIVMNGENEEPFNEVRRLMNKKIANAFINNATHILRTMPIWEPAKNSQGNPVISEQKMYFNYDLERGCLVYQLDD